MLIIMLAKHIVTKSVRYRLWHHKNQGVSHQRLAPFLLRAASVSLLAIFRRYYSPRTNIPPSPPNFVLPFSQPSQVALTAAFIVKIAAPSQLHTGAAVFYVHLFSIRVCKPAPGKRLVNTDYRVVYEKGDCFTKSSL
jgi:hypothetical protein